MAMTFSYKVRDRAGKVIAGAIEADSQLSVASKLRSMGYTIITISEKAEASPTLAGGLKILSRVKPKDLTVFSRQFATMINSGLSITKALNILAEQTESSALAGIVDQLQKDVEGGLSLSEALAKHSKVFPPIFVNMVRAGETGGVLDEVLMRVAEHFEKEAALKGKIKSAMAYPVAVLSLVIIIVFAMITFIVPTFVGMFAQLGGALPLPTQILLAMSNFIRGFWYLILAAIAGLTFGYRAFSATERGRLLIDGIKLKLPVFGQLTRKMSVAKFTRTFSTLISAGVPLLQALDIVADTAGNAVIAGAVRQTRSSIKEGETISKPLASSNVFPPMVVQMISVGEETGALDSMLQKIADFYDEEVTTSVEGLTSLIEPLLMMFMGIAVGGILISLYMPMFQIITLIK